MTASSSTANRCADASPSSHSFDSLSVTLSTVTAMPITPRRLPELGDVPHAIPYQGSKRALTHAIIPLLPDGTMRIVEPFAGSAAVSIAARHTGAARTAVIGDVNEPLMTLWDYILRDPTALADEYESMWQAQLPDPRAYYDEARAKFNATGEPALLLYLLNRCVKAAVRYSKAGDFNQSADHRRLGAKPTVTRKRLIDSSRVLTETITAVGDYAELLLGATSDDVVYMDPPYQGVSNVRDHRYMRGLDRRDFEVALAAAAAREISFIVSYDVVTESRKYGDELSVDLDLTHFHVVAGRSSQATLQGEAKTTIESLYLSPALVGRIGGQGAIVERLAAQPASDALALF